MKITMLRRGMFGWIAMTIGFVLAAGHVPADPPAKVIRVSKNSDAYLAPYHYGSIQQAVDSVSDSSPTSPTLILVYPGTYVENVVLAKSNVLIAGAGRQATRLLAASGTLPALNVDLGTTATVFGVAVSSIAIESTSTTSPAFLVRGDNSPSSELADVTVRDCLILSEGNSAFSVDDSQSVLLEDCLLQGRGSVLSVVGDGPEAHPRLAVNGSKIHLVTASPADSAVILDNSGAITILASSFSCDNSASVSPVRLASTANPSDALHLDFATADNDYTGALAGTGAGVARKAMASNPAFDWTGFTFVDEVAGDLEVKGQLSTSTALVTGDAQVDGNATISGSINPASVHSLGEVSGTKGVFQSLAGTTVLGTNGSATSSYAVAVNGTAAGYGSAALGSTSSVSSGASYAVATGYGSQAMKSYAVAIGYLSKARETDSIAIGRLSECLYGDSVAIGHLAFSDHLGVSLGYQANAGNTGVSLGKSTASGYRGVSIGVGAAGAPWSSSVAIGDSATVTSHYGTAVGPGTSAGYYALAAGNGASAASYATALGYNANTNGYGGTVALGSGATVQQNNQIVLGADYHDVIIPGMMQFRPLTSWHNNYPSLHTSLINLNGELWVKDGFGNNTRLSSHADPQSITPQSKTALATSFADTEVEVPWSVHHFNQFIGKGSVTDMAKLVRWVETKMQAELGEQEGQLVFDYDLPADTLITKEMYEYNQLETHARETGWIEVPLYNGNTLPEEAVESFEVMEYPEVATTRHRIDWSTNTVERFTVTERAKEPVGTERFEKRLRSGFKLGEDGKLYRRAVAEDFLDLPTEELPTWILQRIPETRHR